MFRNTCWSVLATSLLVFISGCGHGDARTANLEKAREINKHNVAKLRSCIGLYCLRNEMKAPKSEKQLSSFLTSGKVNRNLERLDLTVDSVSDIFSSDRDGQPLKVRWGVRTGPIAFETEGVDGIRLVAAHDKVLKVDSDEEFDRLLRGEYEFGPPKVLHEAP